MKIVYLGSGDIGVPTLRYLLQAEGVKLCAVVTQPDRAAGRGLQIKHSLTKETAAAAGIPVLQPAKVRLSGEIERIRQFDPDLFVVMAYGQILPQELLDVPKIGALNLHASLLPRHRGAAPVHAAILAGDEVSGVTVMWMNAGLDTGDILLARSCTIDVTDTAGSLHDKLAGLAPLALAEALAMIRQGNAPRIAQDEKLATYAAKLDRNAGRIDWSESAAVIARKIRGLHPWPGCSADLVLEGGKRLPVKIHRAEASDGCGTAGSVTGPALEIACGGGGMLRLLEVQPSGGKRMAAGEFLRGHRVIQAV